MRFSRSARSVFQLACSSFKLCFFFKFPRWLQGRAGQEQHVLSHAIDHAATRQSICPWLINTRNKHKLSRNVG
eukprot:COSAG01_NODE_511_length_16061_cov_15.815875_8_plen_73_part_00